MKKNQNKNRSIALLALAVAGLAVSCTKDYLKSDQYFKDRLTLEKVFQSKVYSEEWLAHVFEELKGENADVASRSPLAATRASSWASAASPTGSACTKPDHTSATPTDLYLA